MTRFSLDEIEHRKKKTLQWLESLRVPEERFRYRFSENSGESLFTSCFALFILDLFRETENLSKKEKQDWANHIRSFQRQDDGLFYPDPIHHPDVERAVYQVSCFSLSALRILGEQPKYRLSVVDQWKSPESVKNYLRERGCHLGRSGSGNKAMFQGLFLIYERELSGNNSLDEALNSWFEFHEKHKNKHGFWGAGAGSLYYHGLQNAYHQLVVYEYLGREYSKIENAARIASLIQDPWGGFAPTLGGGACKDYDAAHFVGLATTKEKELNPEWRKVLLRAAEHALDNGNADGGFCESVVRDSGGPMRVLQELRFCGSAKRREIFFQRVYATLKAKTRRNQKKNRRWVAEAQYFSESTLWDTWFRWLLVSEVVKITEVESASMFQFQRGAGIGYFRKSDADVAKAALPRTTCGTG